MQKPSHEQDLPWTSTFCATANAGLQTLAIPAKKIMFIIMWSLFWIAWIKPTVREMAWKKASLKNIWDQQYEVSITIIYSVIYYYKH